MTAPSQKRAQTAARVAALRERRAALGLVRLELYVPPRDVPAIRAYAEQLAADKKPAEREPGG